jgi:hypothetical protein
VVVKVNGNAISKYIKGFIKIASPTTENIEVNTRRACAFLSVFNPFAPITQVEIQGKGSNIESRVINLKYI